LYVVPALYGLIARKSQSPEHVTRMLEKLRGSRPAEPAAEIKTP
jgi:hypothetical protein